jgi:putative SOS response-associated peptidase YedK
MCGRYFPPDQLALEQFWRIDRSNWLSWAQPLFNVAPTTVVPIIVRDGDGDIVLTGARCGLVPAWWSKDTFPALTFNARSEEAAEKPTWRQSLRTMRCLMPARGWYEWNEQQLVRSEAGKQVRQPYFFSTKATQLFWDAPLAPVEGTVLVFGRETGGLPAELHERYADRFVSLPIMSERVRSLNLSTTVAIAVYEVLRQQR